MSELWEGDAQPVPKTIRKLKKSSSDVLQRKQKGGESIMAFERFKKEMKDKDINELNAEIQKRKKSE